MHSVNITDCGKYFADRDGPMRYRLEYKVSNKSGVEYFRNMGGVDDYLTYLKQSNGESFPAFLLETPEMYQARLLEYLEERGSKLKYKEGKQKAEERLGVALHLLDSIKVTASREF